jgi:thiamine-monophosphate kinase
VSDGLLGDLGHILERSAVGARIELAALPRSDALQRQPAELQTRAVLAGGDDYELVFTAAPVQRAALAAIAVQLGVALHRIGQITAAAGLVVIDAAGAPLASLPGGFDHFRR